MSFKLLCRMLHNMKEADQIRSHYSQEDKTTYYYAKPEIVSSLMEADIDLTRQHTSPEGRALNDYVFRFDARKIAEHGKGRVDASEQHNYALSRKIELDKTLQGIKPLDTEVTVERVAPQANAAVSEPEAEPVKRKRPRLGEAPANRIEEVGGTDGRLKFHRSADQGKF